ncbi:extracellular solute-binding protein [Nocardiopsis ansamitocini]|uniref:ABC transporter substrate-binding protein n=1 Tax=Nocardiopsis ansamitocini TaxID=1670832 RepID=A0A9W6P8P9_9ACTN|nr:extracellular solute-binding protein [Nocardiopsis ansamitocini]GLU49092.1 ABC transporter substrate-binding protein [Nocardiopsis ansamitocini]
MSTTRTTLIPCAAAVAALTLLASACASPAADGGGAGSGSDGALVIASWGGRFTETTQKHLADPFTEETGIQVQIVDSPGTFATKLQSMSEAGNIEWDIIDSSGAADAFFMAQEGLVQDLPADMRSSFEDALGEGKVSDFGFTYANLGYVIACNDEAVDACPTTIPEFFDTDAFPGRRIMPGEAYSQMTAVLAQAAGRPVDDALPIDVPEMLEPLRDIKADTSVWWTSGDQMEQSLRQGEGDLGIFMSGRAYNLAETGMDVTVNWAGSYDPGYTMAVTDAPNQEEAMQFLQWVVDHPEAQAAWAEEMQYSVPSPDALDLLPTEVAETLADYPANFEGLAQQDFEWYLENKSEIDSGMQQIIQGG